MSEATLDRLPSSAVSRTLQDRIIAGCRILAIGGLLAMLVSVTIEIVGRSFFGHATSWVTEVSTYLVVAITFVGAGFVTARDGNIRVDFIVNRLPASLKSSLVEGQVWFASFVMLIVLWKFTGFWYENYTGSTRSWGLLNTPFWIPQLAVLAGLAAMVVALLGTGSARRHSLGFMFGIVTIGLALVLGLGLIKPAASQIQLIGLFGAIMLAGALLCSGRSSFAFALGTALILGIIFFAVNDLPLAAKALTLVVMLLVLLLSGLPVVFCLLSIGVAAMLFWLPPVSLKYIGERAWGATNTFELTAIPMFVLMGSILVRCNASTEMFTAARYWLGQVRGGLAHAAILACGVFAAVSGSSLATAATMGRVAGPEMMKEGYKPELAYGVLAAGGTLGILIPPSIAMIIYGPLSGVPVTHLFVAGIIPGLMMIGAFMVVTMIWGAIDNNAAPAGRKFPLIEKIRALKGVIPFVGLVALVLGSLYTGIATPTEAAAVGVLGALVISFLRGNLTVKELVGACEEAVVTTSFLLMIAVGAAVMSFSIDFLQMPQALVGLVQSLNLSEFWLFVAIVVLYFLLGMFLEPISMMLITLPIILPVIAAVGWDPLWFGIVLVMLVEIGLITPPVGMILYVLSGVSDKSVSLVQIANGTIPFVFAFLAMIFLFFAFPGFVTFLVK